MNVLERKLRKHVSVGVKFAKSSKTKLLMNVCCTQFCYGGIWIVTSEEPSDEGGTRKVFQCLIYIGVPKYMTFLDLLR